MATPKDIMSYSVKYLSLRKRSEFELRKKLREKQFKAGVIDDAISKLKNSGLIDDSDYLESYLRELRERKRCGKKKIRFMLQKRGLSSKLIDKALSEITGEDERSNASVIAERKIRNLSKLPAAKKRDRLFRHLISQGFDYETTREAVGRLIKDENR